MNIKVTGIKEATARIRDLAKRIPQAAAAALNITSYGLMMEELKEAKDSFKGLTVYVARGFKKTKATPNNLSVMNYIDDEQPGPGRLSPAEILRPHILGGGRERKASERGMAMYLVPSKYVVLDENGNVYPQYMKRVLSAAGLDERWAGHMSNQTARSRARNKTGMRGVYVIPGVGIFQHTRQLNDLERLRGAGDRRWGGSLGGPSVPLFYFVSQPQYEAGTFDFYYAADRYVKENFPKNYKKAMDGTAQGGSK